jgi:hypothetical protein
MGEDEIAELLAESTVYDWAAHGGKSRWLKEANIGLLDIYVGACSGEELEVVNE